MREDPDEIIAKLNEFQPEMLTGYGSVLLLLAQAKKSGKLDIPVKIIANSAEALSPERHVYVEEAFGCPVKNNYCMTEGGEIAMTQDGADLLLNEDFIIVEMSDEEGKPLTDRSQWSQGILVTDLTNYVRPVIRYHVNDVVRIEEIPDDQIRLPRLWIRGRANEVFDYCGKSFTTSGIASASEFHEGVLDFQFVQRSENELSIRGIADALHNKEQVFSSLAEIVENYFREHGADSARVSWSDEALIRKERGGKAPRYVDLRT